MQIDKAYTRDFMQMGRVRVLLKREDGTLCNPAISSSKDKFSYLLFIIIC
jgi:signal recognition particle subunit SRP19